MTHRGLDSVLSELESAPHRLSETAELTHVLDQLSQLPALFGALCGLQSGLAEVDRAELTGRIRAALNRMSVSLLAVESRLHNEHRSVLLQLRELSAQMDWIQTSRQLT